MCCRQDPKPGCRKPEDLRAAPADCSREQIRQCHGDAAPHPCTTEQACEHPDRLKGRPGECSPEQVRQCHGEAAHPCSGA